MDFEVTKRRIGQLEKLVQEIKAAREMLKGELENSAEYMEANEEAKKANDKKKGIRAEIFNQGPNQKLVEDIKANQDEIKLIKEMLNAELFELYKESNSDEITDINGDIRKFQMLAKLLPKKSRYENRNGYGQYSNGQASS